MLEFKFNKDTNVLTITDSYLVRYKEMKNAIQKHRLNNPDAKIFIRSDKSLICEWVVHNFLYSIGFKKNRTKDTDLDYPCDKPEWIYIILGTLLKFFIK